MAESRWIAAVLAAGCVLQIIGLAAVTFPPLQDYPNHLLRSHVLSKLTEVPIYAQRIATDSGFRPNLLADWYLGLLNRWLPLLSAGKVLLCTELALAAVAVWMYLRAFGGNVLAALIGMQVVAGWFFLKANLNFHLAVSLGLIYLALLWPREEELRPHRVLLALIVSLAMLCAHGFVFLVFAGLVGVAALFGDGWRSRQAWLRLTTTLPGGLIFLLFVLAQARSSGLASNRMVYADGLMSTLFWNPLIIWRRFDPILDVATGILAFAVLLLGGLITIGRRLRRGSNDRVARPLKVAFLFALAALALYLVAPSRLSQGWGHMKFRIAYIAVLVSLPLAAAIDWRGARRTATALLAVACILSATSTFGAYRRFDRDAQSIVALAGAVPIGSLILPMDSSPLEQPVRPYLHLWSYICIERDCLSPYLFAERYTQNIYFKQPILAPTEGPGGWAWDSVSTALSNEPYSAVLLRGRSPAVEARLGTVMRLAQDTPGASLFVVDGHIHDRDLARLQD